MALIPDRASQRFNVWLLDVAMLSSQRAAQKVDFDGWERREERRQRRLIYTMDWKDRQNLAGRDATGRFQATGKPSPSGAEEDPESRLF